MDSKQQTIYDETAFPLVESVIQGYNGTIFAYGQTGCGKTHTMTGTDDPENRGIIPNSFMHIFGCIGSADADKCFLVRASYFEIYNEDIRDLLNPKSQKKLSLHEDPEKGVFIKDLSIQTVKSVADIDRAMEEGTKQRITKETAMNARSSRSHAVFTIYLESTEEVEGRQIVKAGKLNLVDLAGSERQKKTHAMGDRLKEAIEINLSLSALGNVISALVDGKIKHIPYRDSKLTRILQDSLGGNTKTVMIAAVSPAARNWDESLSTLRYASRAKFIKNKPRVNEDPKDALLRSYADEINRLKALLEQHKSGEPIIIERVVEKIIRVTADGREITGNEEKEDEYSDDFHEEMDTFKNGIGALESDSEEEPPRGREVPEVEHPKAEQSDEEYSAIFEDDSPQNKKQIQKVSKPPRNPKRRRIDTNDEKQTRLYSTDPAMQQVFGSQSHLRSNQMESDSPLADKRKRTQSQAHQQRKKDKPTNRKGVSHNEIQKLMNNMKAQIVHGGSPGAKAGLMDFEARRKLALKVESQRQEKAQRRAAKQAQEEALLFKPRTYSTEKEEIQESRKIIEKLRSRYLNAVTEIDDLQKEHEEERENILETVRNQEFDLNYYNQVLSMVMTEKEAQLIRHKSRFDHNENKWKVPPFILQQNNVALPKLGPSAAKKLVEKEKQGRVLKFGKGYDLQDLPGQAEVDLFPMPDDEMMEQDDLRHANLAEFKPQDEYFPRKK